VADDKSDANRKSHAPGGDSGATVAVLEPWLIDLLVCPVDRGSVRLDQSELVCIQCDRRYPVLSGIPRMVPDQAKAEQRF
jgi:uncharacterized protein YbaR (Trm112 family)